MKLGGRTIAAVHSVESNLMVVQTPGQILCSICGSPNPADRATCVQCYRPFAFSRPYVNTRGMDDLRAEFIKAAERRQARRRLLLTALLMALLIFLADTERRALGF
jgi:hypothetical protein